MKLNKKGNAAVTFLLVVIILGLIGFIVYDKVLNKKTNETNTEQTISNEKTEESDTRYAK